MSLPDSLKKLSASALCVILLAVSGCTVAPVYGDHATPGSLTTTALEFENPDSREEQIVYQDLAKSFSPTHATQFYYVKLGISDSASSLGTSSSGSPFTTYRRTLTGTLSVYKYETDDKPLFTLKRQASTLYEIASESGIEDYEAKVSAQEKGAHALAETLRLALFAKLPEYN